MNIGFQNDEIFLLSLEEYNKLKDNIPKIKSCYWLRTKGKSIYVVKNNGKVDDLYNGIGVKTGVRPVIKIHNFNELNLKIGDLYEIYNLQWIVIDNGIAISRYNINKMIFGNSYDYEESNVRKFLLNLIK